MGNVNVCDVLRQRDDDAFDRKRLKLTLRDDEHSYYTSLQAHLPNLQLQRPTDNQASELLVNWRREADIVYAPVGDLDFALDDSQPDQTDLLERCESQQLAVTPRETTTSSKEEASLRQLSRSQVSTTHDLFTTVQSLQQKYQSNDIEFLSLVVSYPEAARLFVAHQLSNTSDATMAWQALRMSGDRHEMARYVGRLAFADSCVTSRIKKLQASRLVDQNTMQNHVNRSIPDASCAFCAAVMQDAARLCQLQEQLQQGIPSVTMVGCSLIETIEKLLIIIPLYPDALSRAVLIAREFEINVEQLWNCFLKVFIGTQQLELLLALVLFQRPSFGYFRIVEALIEAREMDMAKRVVDLIQDPDEKYDSLRVYINATNGGQQ